MSTDQDNAKEKEFTITIDLSEANRACALSPENFLQTNQYIQLLKYILQTYEKIPRFKENLKIPNPIVYDRIHDVITVHGKRGTGKTTFLLSALTMLNDEKKFSDFADDKISNINIGNLCVLDIMDPTLFACREHLLHAVLSQIGKKIAEHTRKANAYNCDEKNDKCTIEDWQTDLSKLAKGLKAVGEVREDFEAPESSNSRWEDPEFILQNDISSIQHSMDLEREFHKIVNKALSILGKDAFVLALDDTDTRPAIGWHVLEVIRRYFTTPQLIVIISGDMDLFATIIRQQHIKSLNITKKYKIISQKKFADTIDELAEQYLLKILRPNTRVHLGNFLSDIDLEFLYSLDKFLSNFYIKKSDRFGQIIEKNSLEILSFFMKSIGCHGSEKKFFIITLLNNPIRTVVQVMDVLFDLSLRRLNNNALAFCLCEIFFVQLHRFGLQPFSLQEELRTTHGITQLMEILFEGSEITSIMELLPNHKNSFENEAILTLHVNFIRAVFYNPAVAYMYLFKACFLFEILNKGIVHQENKFNTQMKNYLSIEYDDSVYITVKKISAMMWAEVDDEVTIRHGSMCLYSNSKLSENRVRLQRKLRLAINNFSDESIPPEYYEIYKKFEFNTSPSGELSIEHCVNSIFSLRESVFSWNKNFIMAGSFIITKPDNNAVVFSVMSILSLMGDIISCETEDEILTLLNRSCVQEVIPSYKYDSDNQNINYDYFKENFENAAIENVSIDEKFVTYLLTWRKNLKKLKKPVLYATLCSRIMRRFFASLRTIPVEDCRNLLLGTYIHRCLVLFFNAVLVEEFMLSEHIHDKSKSVSLLEPVDSDKYFIINMFSAHAMHENSVDTNSLIISEELSVFKHIFTCPLWGMYLNKHEIFLYKGKNITVYDVYEQNMINIYDEKKNNEYLNSDSNIKDDFMNIYKVTYHKVDFSNMYPLFNTVYAYTSEIYSQKKNIRRKNVKRNTKSNALNIKNKFSSIPAK